MKVLRGRVAVISGGAGTLGQALAGAFAAEGMKLVLADLQPQPLARAVDKLRRQGAEVIGVPTDVSVGASVEALAQRALAQYGGVHVVVNNAGVAPLGALWESSAADWEWALGVNLWGVVHGVRVFAPILLAAADEGHIVNTASVAGLINPPGMGVYNVTKHAVVSLSETLQHDLAVAGSKVRCSVVCPAYFPSGIADSERNRPKSLENQAPLTSNQRALQATLVKAVGSGRIGADEIAAQIVRAIREETFYVHTHPRILDAVRARMEDVLGGTNPRNPLG